MYKLLVINPGSTSTKIGVYNDDELIFEETIRHSSEELADYERINQQKEFRKNLIIETLRGNGIDTKTFTAIVGRGGLTKPIESGTYLVNEAMLKDLRLGRMGEHASNLGGLIAHDIASENQIQAYIVDPVVVDELQDVARISGIKEIQRVSIFHALNQKAVARRYASSIDRRYEDLNLIVVHLGGGISVGAHEKGRGYRCGKCP